MLLNKPCYSFNVQHAIRAASSFTPYKPSKQIEEDKRPSLFTNFGQRVKNRLLGKGPKDPLIRPSEAPLNFSYPNKKGERDYEYTTDLDEVSREIGGYVKNNINMAATELKDGFCIDKAELVESTLGPVQNQACIDYDFKSKDSLKIWRTGCDSVWGRGFSNCKLERTEHNTALFSGYLDTRIIRDGKVERAGWASMKTVEMLAFNRKNYKRHWDYYSHLLIKCRGDGRSYKIMLHSPGHIDMTWHDSHSYSLHTHGGPYWQYERIPFSKFFIAVGGRIQDIQKPVPKPGVSSIGIVLMDRVDGPFKLEIDYIGVVQDHTHEESFAYETYSLPIYTVMGY